MVCAKAALRRFSGGLHIVSTKTLPACRAMVRFLNVRCVVAPVAAEVEGLRSASVGEGARVEREVVGFGGRGGGVQVALGRRWRGGGFVVDTHR